MSTMTQTQRMKFIEALSAISVLSEKMAKELINNELDEKAHKEKKKK